MILTYGAFIFLAGAVLQALLKKWESRPVPSALIADCHLILLFVSACRAGRSAIPGNVPEDLGRIEEADRPQENWRRLWLDLVRFAMAITVAGCILIVSRYVPSVLTGSPPIEPALRRSGHRRLRIDRRFCPVRHRSPIPVDPAGARIAGSPEIRRPRGARSKGLHQREKVRAGRRRQQSVSKPPDKPDACQARLRTRRGVARHLFVINLLSRFWFNVGTLGEIPTILSARWVLIDGGRRLLFLDNYGGAWDSYLNEFIDLTAVKGLNAIWTNTFVEVEGKEGQCYSFPKRVLFLEGGPGRAAVQGLCAGEPGRDDRMVQRLSDAERCEHQYEHRCRQSLSEPLAACEIDAVVQNL